MSITYEEKAPAALEQLKLTTALTQLDAAAQQAAAASSEVELIPREILFGNPERSNVQISPDGRYLSWVAPVDGVANVWVAPADNPSQARAVTSDKARGIRQYFWSYRTDTLLYLRDTGILCFLLNIRSTSDCYCPGPTIERLIIYIMLSYVRGVLS